MKKFLVVFLMFISIYVFAQTDNAESKVQRYKIYPTENINISLKLDTATGRIWMVKIGLGDNDAMTVILNDESLIMSSEEIKAGRFELCKNMYNFILLDTQNGYMFQVQWHTNLDKRIIVPIL
ncbi:MAG: hypothetical protein II981_05595 [Bacteroidales bacterium]|nr:hypothetical protein [Bacteroidales bacterium]